MKITVAGTLHVTTTATVKMITAAATHKAMTANIIRDTATTVTREIPTTATRARAIPVTKDSEMTEAMATTGTSPMITTVSIQTAILNVSEIQAGIAAGIPGMTGMTVMAITTTRTIAGTKEEIHTPRMTGTATAA